MRNLKMFFVILFFSISLPFIFQERALAGCYAGGESIIDNDNGQINSPDNPYSGNWVYESGSNSYRGDHRYLASPPSSGFVEYDWNHPECSRNSDLWIYIWNSKFTNPAASYRVYTNSLDRVLLVSINQKLAPGGWSKVGSTSASGGRFVALVVSFTQSGGTGADGTKLVYK
jgi:hypothetical protein